MDEENQLNTNNHASETPCDPEDSENLPENPDDVTGPNYYEEKWSRRSEKLVMYFREHITEMTKNHEEIGYQLKKKNYCLSIPTFIFPLIMTFVQVVFIAIRNVCSDSTQIYYDIANGFMFLISSILNWYYTSQDLGTQSALHLQYSARYYDLLTRIDMELSRDRKYRIAPDVFITDLRCQINNLNQNGPTLE
jgi:hypothetical protein